jgi:hypothetical protein
MIVGFCRDQEQGDAEAAEGSSPSRWVLSQDTTSDIPIDSLSSLRLDLIELFGVRRQNADNAGEASTSGA